MSKFIVDEDGQVFHSPISLDEFSYYRDYILVRIFKEFLDLNPKSDIGGWVDYSGPDYWDQGTYNDGHWEGNKFVLDGEYDDVDFTPQNVTFPDGQKPFTRYLTPTYIRVTITDKYGIPKSRTMDVGGFGDGEWMESMLTGNVLEGQILVYNATIPPSGQTNQYITGIEVSGFNAAKGDIVEKVEFKFDRLPDWNAIDYFRDISDIAPEIPIGYFYTPGASDGGAPTIGHTMTTPNKIYFSIWGGSSWSNYDPSITTYYTPYFQIANDKFGVVHIFVPFTNPIPPYPTGYVYDTHRYDWTLAGGLTGPFSMHLTEQLDAFRENNYQIAYDSNGYTHFYYVTVERNGAEAPNTPMRLRHYYQDASGWHSELMFYIGYHPDYIYSDMGQACEAYIDSYGRSHFFESVRDSTLSNYGIMYAHNRDGSWKHEILYPFNGQSVSFLRAWIVGDQQYILASDNAFTDGGLVLYQKEWSETNWTKTWILAEGETEGQSRKTYRDMGKLMISEDGLFAHLLFIADASAENARMWEYYKLNILTLEMEQEYVFGYPNPIYLSTYQKTNIKDMVANLKNGVPVTFTRPDSEYKGFIETLILE